MCLLYWRVFLQYEEQGHGFAGMRAYAERLGGSLIVEPTGPVGGASVTGAAGATFRRWPGWTRSWA